MPQRNLPPTKIWKFLSTESQKIDQALLGISDFNASQSCLSSDKKSGFVVDESRRRICFFNADETEIRRRLFDYTDILGCEIVEDGYIISSTSGRGGGAGMRPARVVSPRPTPDLNMLALKLVMNAVESAATKSGGDAEQPETVVHIVRFLHKNTSRQSQQHKAALTKSQDWFKLFLTYMQIVSTQSPNKKQHISHR